jgi:exosortase
MVLLTVFALLWLVTRFLHEASPIWRLTSWLLALESAGLIFVLVRLALGPAFLAHLAFPICFFFVAVPWPSQIEGPLIRWLTYANTALTVEAVGWFGVPAIQLGNVIEIGTGMVGIDEACSGIRSFQSTLMISLFLGELYRLNVSRRALLCLVGFGLALTFNFCRTLILVLVAANKGVAAIADWHDPAGASIMAACLVGLWAVGLVFKRQGMKNTVTLGQRDNGLRDNGQWDHGTTGPRDFRTKRQQDHGPRTTDHGLRTIRRMAFALLVWLVLVEAGTEYWFRLHEKNEARVAEWAFNWPVNNPTFRRTEISEGLRGLMGSDKEEAGSWQEADGSQWQVFYFRWLPARWLYNRVKVQIAKTHSPERCIPAAGAALKSDLGSSILGINKDLNLPFHKYSFDVRGGPLHVFFMLAEDTETDTPPNLRRSHWQRLVAGLSGSRNYGQRSLEVAVWGYEDVQAAEAAVVRQLERLVRAEDKTRN